MKLNPLALMRKEFDGCGIVFEPATNKAMSLNKTGVVIWESIEAGLSEAQITAAVTEKFEVAPEVAAGDVAAFLQLLKEKGLLAEA